MSKYETDSVMLRFNEKISQQRIQAFVNKDEYTASIPNDEEQLKHVNWAKNLEVVIDTEDPNLHPIADIKVEKATDYEYWLKPILKHTRQNNSNSNSDTDASSDEGEAEYKTKTDKNASRSFSLKRVEFLELNIKELKPISSYRYPNKRFLVEILEELNQKRTDGGV